jgi:hypothetical protein
MMPWVLFSLILLVGLSGWDAVAGTWDVLDYDTDWLTCVWTQGKVPLSLPADRFRMTCGPTPGSYSYPPQEQLATDNHFPLKDLVPGAGTHYCTCYAGTATGMNRTGAPEYAFVAHVGGDGGVDVIAPTIEIDSPETGSTVVRRSDVRVSMSASDAVGVTEVILFVNRKSEHTCRIEYPPYDCVWRVPASPGKAYTLQAQARDAAGNMSLSTTVRVTSDQPLVGTRAP